MDKKEKKLDQRAILVTGLEVHRQAARFFVGLAAALDRPGPADIQVNGCPVFGGDACQSAALAAVLNAHSAVEALVNELYLCHEQDLNLGLYGVREDFSRQLDIARRSGVDRLSVRSRLDIAVMIKQADAIDWEQGIAQEFLLLSKLRNELVHHKARWIDDSRVGPNSEDDIERQLYGRFPHAVWPSDGDWPFRWIKCLGAGCATWAWSTARLFINDVSKRLQLGIQPMNY